MDQATSQRLALHERRLPEALRLSQALNWPYRLEDWRDALRLGHGIGVEVDGELRATALWWPWGERFATCGMIIVDAALQGRGIGRALVCDLLEAGEHTMLLRSTAAGRRLYEQLGFVAFGRVHQHQATLAAQPLDVADLDEVRDLQPGDTDGMRELDRAASGMDRGRLLEALLAAGQFVVAGPPDQPTGYACVRRWGRGHVLGPVVAADGRVARALITTALRRHAGEFLRIDVTEDSGVSSWLEGQGLPCVDRVTSMARGTPPQHAPQAALVALASQSLG